LSEEYKTTVTKLNEQKLAKDMKEIKDRVRGGHVPDALKKLVRERLG